MIKFQKPTRPLNSKKIIFGLSLLLICILGIGLMEMFSRACPQSDRKSYPSCYNLIMTHVENPDPIVTLLPQEPLNEDLATIISKRLYEVKRDELKGNNGIACSRYGFVADDLPGAAMPYVKTHEALHLLSDYDETSVNFKAAKIEPLGMIETVGYSIYLSFSQHSITEYPCVIGRMWSTFKVYFLHSSRQ